MNAQTQRIRETLSRHETLATARGRILGQIVFGVAPVLVDTFRLCVGGVQMAKTHPPYVPEYRRQMVELVGAGRMPGELAPEFECSASSIRNVVHQAERDEGHREYGLTSSKLDELRRLRRRVVSFARNAKKPRLGSIR